jgi:septum site-determining protein MinC
LTFAAPIQKKSIRFRARSFVAFTLTPEAPLEEWLAGLDHWTENSPGFFTGRPVVLDLAVLKPEVDQIQALVVQLGQRGIRVYAIEMDGVDTLDADLPPLLAGAREATAADALYLPPDQNKKDATPAEAPAPQRSNTLLIEAPVRSGQSVLHTEGDVIILGSVASGSEIVAGGSIHVYGTLRGRAIAGATGNPEARIFCRRNEAELLAIDGWYRTAEEMDASLRGKPVQAFLDDKVLWVAPLN